MLQIPEYKNLDRVLYFFEKISSIPHGSGNTKAIADYFVSFAEERGLEYCRDGADNVIIRKPATPGYEGRPAIIFQGHLDMVEAKTPDATIDMKTEGLSLYRDGDFIKARGTTLGGDDGVALAYAMAVLDDDTLPHPDFEAVFTSDEEIGLLGAVALDPDCVKGRLLINIDSDEEGVFTVGCAGGMRSDISMPVKRARYDATPFLLEISGFKGGHSGVEINNGRVNAIKVLSELLAGCRDIRIADIEGGNADNAIPRSARCTFYSDDDVRGCIDRLWQEIFEKYKELEPDITMSLSAADNAPLPADGESTRNIVSILGDIPSGVVAMSAEIEGLVETSLNPGILSMSEGALHLSLSVRSAKGQQKRMLGDRLRNISESFGADYSERGEYPAWEYRAESHLRDVMASVYERMYGKAPKIIIIHAGLECGIFSEKIPGLDCVSIGPDNYDIHTTEERLSVSSLSRVWEYLKEVLKNI